MRKYLSRCVDSELRFLLKSSGAVWVRGPKWCGKSTTAQQIAGSTIYMQDENTRDQNVTLARIAPSLFLDEPAPLLIDEWQVIPFIWNQIRHEVDQRGEFGQFILTGSVQPDLDNETYLHSGTGRISQLLMRPMSLFESGESSGAVSLSKLFEGETDIAAKSTATLRNYAFYTARGGWPQAIGRPEKVALAQAVNYYNAVVTADISEPDGVRRDPELVQLLMRSYARNCASQANNSTIRSDTVTNERAGLNLDTIASYIKALKRLFLIEESSAWNPNLRSAAAVRTSNTRYFVDPSIACAALGAGPDALIKDLNTFGLLFENLCVRDLRVYSQSLGGTVKHYRNSNGQEADAVITLPDGRWAAVEVKLGGQQAIETGARNLLAIAADISPKLPKPSFLMVLTGTQVAYRRDDGVLVAPIATLGL